MDDLQGALPKRDVLYTVIAPKARPLYFGLIRAKEPIRSEDNNKVKLTWSYDQLDALSPETFSPPYPEIGSMVSVSITRAGAISEGGTRASSPSSWSSTTPRAPPRRRRSPARRTTARRSSASTTTW